MNTFWLRFLQKAVGRLFTAGALSLGLLFIILSLGSRALAAGGAAIDWRVLAGAGGPAVGVSASGSSITLNDTLGQPVAGSSSAGNLSMGVGYWYGLGYDETQCGLVEGATYYFNQTWPISITVQTLGNLDCLRVLRVDQDHPAQTGDSNANGLGWGRYWTITATRTTDLQPAGNFTLTLTLPNDQGFLLPRLCRYADNLPGAGWDCDNGSHTVFSSHSITRRDVSVLSDWALGSNVGPTNVVLEGISAYSSGPRPVSGMISLFTGLVMSAAIIRLLRRITK